jgi:hypothetical protein
VTIKRTASDLGRVFGSGLIVILVGAGIFSTDVATATPRSKMGIVTGTLQECPTRLLEEIR